MNGFRLWTFARNRRFRRLLQQLRGEGDGTSEPSPNAAEGRPQTCPLRQMQRIADRIVQRFRLESVVPGWEMIPMVRPSNEVRTLGEALEAGLGNAAVWLATVHPTLDAQYRQITAWFPNMRHQSIQAAMRYVRDTVFAGQRANQPGARQIESIVPQNPTIGRRGDLRYYVRITLTSTEASAADQAGGAERVAYLQLTARRMRTADEIRREMRRQILDTLRSQHERYYVRAGMPSDIETYSMSVEVLGIQRR